MAIVILPTSSDSNGAADAQTRLQIEIDDPFTAVMIVQGMGPEVNRVIEVGSARASIPQVILRRRVIWIPDPAVLTSQQRRHFFAKGAAAAFIDLKNKVSSRLTLSKAQIAFYVEQAFTDAGG